MEDVNIKIKIDSPKRPLLQTKLCMPRIRSNPVERSRLLERLNGAIGSEGHIHPKLTLITGAAGYGKTTLATQWIAQLNRPAAWLSLDVGDNDEARFLAYLFAAIGTVQEEIGEAALGRLTTTYLYNETEAILTALLNDLAVCDETAVIVLDDYHLINSDAVHQAVTFILQHMPVQMHLIITSRTEPPLPIALLRARNTLNWINARDLRFTPDEATQFLQQTMGVTLTHEQIVRLDEQVEGWVTGLQLIALALQDEIRLRHAFSGNQRYLVDYLADQVMDRQSAVVQEFLLQTAVLTQFNASLCKTVTGTESQTMLEQIEAANLFLIPLDAHRKWYRYHHLFGDFLNGRLVHKKSSAEIAQLHQRAAHWYHQNDQSLIAVDHALTAADYPLAVSIMCDVARQVLMFGEGSTLRQWVEALPPEMQTERTELTLFYIWSLIRTGEFSRAKKLLEATYDKLNTRLLWGEWAALRARLAMITGDTDINIRFSEKALHKLPEDQHMLRSEVAINLGFSHLQRADLEAARDAFAEAAQNRTHDPGLWAAMFATFYWGQTYERQAQLQDAYDIYQRGLEMGMGQDNGRLPAPPTAVGFMHVGLGKLLYEWNRLAEAETHLRRALSFAERSGDHKMLIYSREALAQLLATLGDWDAANQILADLEQQIQSPGSSKLRTTLALQQGDLATAEQWTRKLGIGINDSTEQLRDFPFAYLELVKQRLARREFDALIPLLNELEQFGQERNNRYFLINVSLLKALTYAKQGELETAVPLFQHTLTMAEPGGYVRLFLNCQDASLGRLLHRAAGNGITAVYALTLLQHLDAHATVDKPLPQPLSNRELEVLQYLSKGLTNRAIAEKMVVTINTVKAHARRLYAKLHVNSRTQAVARARELQLLK